MENGSQVNGNELIVQIKEKIEERSVRLDEITQNNGSISKNSPFVITFVGKFKTGKSSLINALLEYDLLPTQSVSATAVVTRIVKGEKLECFVIENDGKQQNITLEQAKDIILNSKAASTGNNIQVLMKVPVPWLAPDVELRDTPGLEDSAQDGALEAVTLAALKDTDFCICVYDASSIFSSRERERTKAFNELLGGNVAYVVNCINRLNSKEGYDLVEKTAKKFFSSFDNSIIGEKKQYMICSAPGNYVLDGFDVWFKTLVDTCSDQKKLKMHIISLQSRRRTIASQILADQGQDLILLQSQKEEVLTKHNESLRNQRKAILKQSESVSDRIENKILPEARDLFADTEGLQEELKKEYGTNTYQNDYGSYSQMCKTVTTIFFKQRYDQIVSRWNDIYTGKFTRIENVIDRLSFPEKHTTKVSATTGERVGGAGIGAGIGFLFGGPIGGAIGGVLGALVGSASTNADDSVANTMTFI